MEIRPHTEMHVRENLNMSKKDKIKKNKKTHTIFIMDIYIFMHCCLALQWNTQLSHRALKVIRSPYV